MKIPLTVPCIQGNEWKYLKECLDTGWLSSLGAFVKRFENDIRTYAGAKNAVACVNGTTALQVALRVLGVGPCDEVIVPTVTFIAPVNAVRYVGAEPVFMDCDDYLNLCPEKLALFCERECVRTKKGLKNKRTGKIVKGIIPVHVFGNPCDLEAICAIAKRYSLKVVEDATESLGSFYTTGRYKGYFTGTIGECGVYSFNGNKIITTGGGGMILTNDRIIAKKAHYLTNQAKDDPIYYVHDEVGYNFRLTNVQAAIGVAQLEKLEGFIARKRRHYLRYQEELEGLEGLKLLGVPEGTRPNYWLFSLLVDQKRYGMTRDDLMYRLRRLGIEACPLWHLNHLQKPYLRNQAYRIERAMRFSRELLNIPSSVGLSERELNRVVSCLKDTRG